MSEISNQKSEWITCPSCNGTEEVFVDHWSNGGDVVPCFRCRNGKVRRDDVQSLIPNKILLVLAGLVVGLLFVLAVQTGLI